MEKSLSFIISFIFFIVCLSYYVLLLSSSFSGNFTLGPFDESLKLLQSLYFSQGLIPYNDFSFVYPPGQILIHTLIKTDITQTVKLFAILNLIFSIPLLFSIYRKTKSFGLLGTIILLISITFNALSNPITEVIWIWIAYSLYLYSINGKSKYLIWIIGFSTFFFLIRWDRIIGLFFLFSSSFIIMKFLPKNYLHKIDFNRLKKIILSLLISIFLGFIFLIIFLLLYHVEIKNAFYFIFIIPFKISPFRDLPLFSSDLINNGKIVYVFLILSILLYSKLLIKFKNKLLDNPDLISFIIPLSTIPYALGRTDVSHMLPFIISMALVLAYYLWKKSYFFIILLSIGIIYIFYSLIYYNFNFKEPKPLLTEILSSCRRTVSSADFKSIFVGRESYSHYLINYPILYLISPDKKPASKYISDEPGLQNNCYDSGIISTELEQSDKPMLGFIETSEQRHEPNKSSKMKSCGKIESFLNSNKYTILGTCSINDAEFEVRIYK